MIEGIVTLFCVPLVLWFVPDYPARGKYLYEQNRITA